MSEDDVRALVLKHAAPFATRRGSLGLRQWCHKHDVAPNHVSEFLGGKRGPGGALLAALGLEYRIVRKIDPHPHNTGSPSA